MTVKISEPFVKKVAKPATGRAEYWDDELTGFGLRVSFEGRKVWFVKYRASGVYRRYKIGTYPAVKEKDARKKAETVLAQVQLFGIDPALKQVTTAAPIKVKALVEKFLASQTKMKASTLAEYRRNLERHVVPILGNREAASLIGADIHDIYVAMGDKNMKTTANRTVAYLRSVINWGIALKLLPRDMDNPCKAINKRNRYEEKAKQRYLTEAEFKSLAEAINRAEEANGEPASAILAIRLLALTGARRNEILTAKWDWLDMDAGTLSLPDSKTGEKVIHLGAPAVALLQAAKRDGDNPYICPGKIEKQRLVGLQRVWDRIRTAAGIPDVRLHDLRHSFATVATGSGSSLPLIGAMLGHKNAKTTARYAHADKKPVAAVTDSTSSTISAYMGGKTGEVVPLRK